MTVNTRGLDAIRNGLPGAIEAGVVRGAGFIKDLASQLAPKDTGDLSRDIKVMPGDTQTSRKVVAGANLPDARAVFQEYGTSRMAAQPYMTPAYREINVQQEVAAEVRALIGRSRS